MTIVFLEIISILFNIQLMTKVGANSFIWIKRQKFTCFIVCRTTFKGLIIRIFKILSQKQTAPYPNVL